MWVRLRVGFCEKEEKAPWRFRGRKDMGRLEPGSTALMRFSWRRVTAIVITAQRRLVRAITGRGLQSVFVGNEINTDVQDSNECEGHGEDEPD
jgi:hypothetical protein